MIYLLEKNREQSYNLSMDDITIKITPAEYKLIAKHRLDEEVERVKMMLGIEREEPAMPGILFYPSINIHRIKTGWRAKIYYTVPDREVKIVEDMFTKHVDNLEKDGWVYGGVGEYESWCPNEWKNIVITKEFSDTYSKVK